MPYTGRKDKPKEGKIILKCSLDLKSRIVKAAQKDPETGNLSNFVIKACEEKLKRDS